MMMPLICVMFIVHAHAAAAVAAAMSCGQLVPNHSRGRGGQLTARSVVTQVS